MLLRNFELTWRSIYFFAVYSAVISYAALYHWNDIKMGFKSLLGSMKKSGRVDDFKDIHTRLMEIYTEVPEWWYLILNVSFYFVFLDPANRFHRSLELSSVSSLWQLGLPTQVWEQSSLE